MKTINLYTFNELTTNAKHKATEKFAYDVSIKIEIAEIILADYVHYNFEFLEDGTRIQTVKD